MAGLSVEFLWWMACWRAMLATRFTLKRAGARDGWGTYCATRTLSSLPFENEVIDACQVLLWV